MPRLGAKMLLLLLVLPALSYASLPPGHAKFTGHFKCPYASTWLKHGPEKAAELLAIAPENLLRRSFPILVKSRPYWCSRAAKCTRASSGHWWPFGISARLELN